MPLTRFPHGISSRGVPVLGGGADVTTGNVFFVGNTVAGAADDVTFGTTEKPFLTLDYAIGRCTASNGDRIYLMPGHYEEITAASEIDIDVAGISIIGLGNSDGGSGTGGATIVFSDPTASIEINSDGCLIQNVTLLANAADITNAIFATTAIGSRLIGCKWYEQTNLNFLVCYSGGTATKSNYVEIAGCHAVCPDAANTHFAYLPGTTRGIFIHDNLLMGDWGIGAIAGATNVTGVLTYAAISNNLIYNFAETADACINLASTATGIVALNMCTGGHATDGINVGDAGGLENYYEEHTSDLSGILEPANA